MFKLGAITVGQSPRADVTDDIMGIFNGKLELIERGALDGLTLAEVALLKPEEGDYVLVSRMRDGTQVFFAEEKILPRIQECIHQLEQEGVQMILFFCTGEFAYPFESCVPCVYPGKLITSLVPALCGDEPLIVITPLPEQVEQTRNKWRKIVPDVTAVAASPYGDMAAIEKAGEVIRTMTGSLVIMDCIGYSQAMKKIVARKTGKKVILSRTMAARVISELADI